LIFVVSVDVEEIPMKGHINDYSTVIQGIPLLVDLFREFGISSTFFVTSNVAKDTTDTVRELAKHNHEIACHGDHLTPLDFQNDKTQYANLKSATETIEDHLNVVLEGFRAPFNRVDDATLRALIKLGYKYDSSVMPSSRLLSKYYYPEAPKDPYNPSLNNPYKKGSSPILEIPISTLPIAKVPLGLSYMRLMGLSLFKFLFSQTRQDIVSFYLHTYDLFSLPKNMDLPLRFRLISKSRPGFDLLRGFLTYVSETFTPEYLSAKEALNHLHVTTA
jgi:hypothetical protein